MNSIVPSLLTQTVKNDTHALGGSNTQAIASDVNNQTMDTSASTQSPTGVLGDSTGNTSENVQITAAGLTPSSATNVVFLAASGVQHKITNAGTITTRIRRTNAAGALLATHTTASLSANSSERIKVSTYLTNETVASHVYCVTSQASTAGQIEFGLALSNGYVVMSGSDTHALTGSAGSCS